MRPFSRFLALAAVCSLPAQVIEFESGGLQYQTLTKNGLTVMFAHLPTNVREFSILQLAVSNGSGITHAIKPEDCVFEIKEGAPMQAIPARRVVDSLIAKASRNDVIRMVSTYELGLYGLSRFKSTNGYEQRRQSALAEVGSGRLKAAAAASAIAFVSTKLVPGQSTDGAVFFFTGGKSSGPGRLVVRVSGEVFEFNPDQGFTN
jgi:hypothetical protein